MKSTAPAIAIVIVIAASFLIVGCGKGDVDPPGKDANANKTYTKEDAMNIKPKRKGSESEETGN